MKDIFPNFPVGENVYDFRIGQRLQIKISKLYTIRKIYWQFLKNQKQVLEWKFKVLTFFKNINNIDLSEEDKYWLSTIRDGFII